MSPRLVPSPRALLLFPPHVLPWSPYLAPALLTAYARQHGFDVDQRDLNLPYFERLLSRSACGEAAARLESLAAALERRPRLSAAELYRLRLLVEGIGDAEYAMEHVEEAKAILRSRRFFDVEAYRWAMGVIDLALAAASARWFPSELNSEGFRSRCSPFSVTESLAFAEAEGENPFLEFYREILPALRLESYGFIGISVAFADQVLAAITLARQIKARHPSAFVCLGGNFYSRVGPGLGSAQELFTIADAVVVGEGERPLVSLLTALANSTPDAAIPGVVRWSGGRMTYTPNRESVPARDLPTPEFDGLDLNGYLSPEPVLPLLTFKGCSYGKCAFCDHHVNYLAVSGRPGAKVADDIAALARAHGCRSFTFVDEEMPPAHAEAVARAIVERRLPEVRWMGYAVYSRNWTRERWKLLARSGCREMLFGFESASKRVLEMMKKPHSPDEVVRITGDLNAVGIASRINVIVGFPGEIEEEAEMTFRFFADHRDLFDVPETLIAFHPFLLVRNGPLARSEVGRRIVRLRREQPLSLHYAYDVTGLADLAPGGGRLVDAHGAFELAREYAERLSALYGKTCYPVRRVHRFLYTAGRPPRPLRRCAEAPAAGSRASGPYEAIATPTRLTVSRFDIEPAARTNREAARACEPYEFWMNMLSRKAEVARRLERAIPGPLFQKGGAKVYAHLHIPGESGAIRSEFILVGSALAEPTASNGLLSQQPCPVRFREHGV